MPAPSKRAWIAGLMLLLAACSSSDRDDTAPSTGELRLEPVSYDQMRDWGRDAHAEALAAFLQSCRAFTLQPETAAVGQGKLLSPVTVWKGLCREAAHVPAGDHVQARGFFEAKFVPFRAYNGDNPTGLFTGYYEPQLSGSLTRHRPYVYPIYGVPAPGTPSYTRSQIDFNMLDGKAPILAFVDDPVELFFLQVLWENPSYIFFRPLTDGPTGSQQVPLTPGRSMAVDERFVPLGMPVFVDTVLPSTEITAMSVTRRLMVAQDTGSAINGPVRGDMFFGFGQEAEALAGAMRSGGQAYLLVPRPLAAALGDVAP